MATRTRIQKTKTSNTQSTNNLQLRSNLFTFLAAFLGVTIGFAASLAVVLPMIHAGFDSQAKKLSQRAVSMMPASVTTDACTQPGEAAAGAPAGQVLGASAVVPTVSPAVAQPPVSSNPTAPAFVHKLVSGAFAKTNADISNTGPDSSNAITTVNSSKTTISNDNNLTITSTNAQDANTGKAITSGNTTGGAAISGDATNTNNVAANINLTN